MSKRKRKKAGRKSILTRQVQDKICQMIRAGVYDYVAAEAAGISANTFGEWIRRAEGKDGRSAAPVFATFATAVRLAKAEARAATEVTVRKLDPKWWLARMHRDRPGLPGWTDSQHLEHTGKDGGPIIKVDAVAWRDEMLRLMDEEDHATEEAKK